MVSETVSYLLFTFSQNRRRPNFSRESQIGWANLLPWPLAGIFTHFLKAERGKYVWGEKRREKKTTIEFKFALLIYVNDTEQLFELEC